MLFNFRIHPSLEAKNMNKIGKNDNLFDLEFIERLFDIDVSDG